MTSLAEMTIGGTIDMSKSIFFVCWTHWLKQYEYEWWNVAMIIAFEI